MGHSLLEFCAKGKESRQKAVAVAEVVHEQDTELSRPFLGSLYENLSWLDLPIKSD